MNGRILLSSLALAGSVVAVAQNQNWTATDMNGQSHSIQSYVDQGKTVLVDISAHWCGPCWGWHNSGIMEKMYEEFGPEGTNDLMVIYIDGSSNPPSTTALLEGAAGSQGDWTAGTPYPIIGPNGQGQLVANNYDFGGFPTLFMHCPGSSAGVEIARTGSWEQFYTSWRNACPAAFNNGAVDATLFEAGGVLCPGDEPKVPLHNQGTTALTSATVALMNGATTVSTVNWTGNLARWATADVSFPGVVVNGPTEFTAVVSQPNGGVDAHPEGDEQHVDLDVAPSMETATVQFQIRTDSWAEETSWKLYNSNNQVVAQFGPYTQTTDDNTTFNYNWVLNTSECYRLEVLDAYGDGICCAYGQGFYKVINNGVVIAEGAEYGAVEAVPFQTGAIVGIEENVLDRGLSIFPNPTNGILNVSMELPSAAVVNMTVVNMLGEVVYQQAQGFGSGAQQVTMDLNELSAGSYFLNLVADGVTATRKVTITK
jgi:hypothetical protein